MKNTMEYIFRGAPLCSETHAMYTMGEAQYLYTGAHPSNSKKEQVGILQTLKIPTHTTMKAERAVTHRFGTKVWFNQKRSKAVSPTRAIRYPCARRPNGNCIDVRWNRVVTLIRTPIEFNQNNPRSASLNPSSHVLLL